MSFPRYPQYKDSGVEWLGEVPVHWSLRRIGYFFRERREKVSDKDFPALSVTKNGIVPQLDTAAKSDDGDNRKRVCQGDFVINSRSDRKGSSGTSNLGGSVSLICTVMQPQQEVNTTYMHHLFRSQPFQEEFYRNGKGIVADLWSTNYSEMRNILLGMPPPTEQAHIAAFLDRETAKIDELVTEQRRLMDLLKEKRQTVISHAVTRGLNPDAPMKPSGNKWLGAVPAHWTVCCLKHIKAEVKNAFVDGPFGSNLKSEHFIDDGDVYVIESNFATQGRIDTEKLKTISSEHFATINRSETRGGDIVIAKIGAQYGKASILPVLDKPAVVSGNSLKLTINQKSCDVQFVNWHLSNLKELGVMEDIVNATAQPALSLGEMNNLPMLAPPRAEQQEIVAFLNEKLGEFDTLTTEAQYAIDLLQERRTALISAAVTGQIDVRENTQREESS